jgi:hypothetical protein
MGLRRIAALMLFAAGCGGAATAGAPGRAAPGSTDLDQLERDLASAERDLDGELASAQPVAPSGAAGEAAEAPTTASPAEEPAGGDEERAPKEADKAAALDSRSANADRCSTACKAYQSMRRSADRICEIAGADDERCGRARRRVDSARAQIQQSPCRCELP